MPPGVETVNGIPVRRFRVKHERDPLVFGKRSDRVFLQRHSLGDELDWLDAEGPTSPALVEHIAKHAGVTRFSVSAHKLRHASATVALAAGVNPLAISKLLNHSSMRTTEQYLHLIPTALAEARDLARAGLTAYTARAGAPLA